MVSLWRYELLEIFLGDRQQGGEFLHRFLYAWSCYNYFMILSRATRIVLVAVAFLVVAMFLFYVRFYSHRIGSAPNIVACTEEALICPDGSGVGRSGPSCLFAPCPTTGELVGELIRDAQGARLAIFSPEGVGTGVTYAVPLVLGDGVELGDAMVGKMVTLSGTFSEGNTFVVKRIVETSETPDAPSLNNEMTLGVGETGFVAGVKVTLNSIASDSRCPSDVQCIWAGTVTARVILQSDTDKETVELSLGTPHAFDVSQVTLLRVSPSARSTERIDTKAYRLTFQVVK
jgi:hypothetical protein